MSLEQGVRHCLVSQVWETNPRKKVMARSHQHSGPSAAGQPLLPAVPGLQQQRA